MLGRSTPHTRVFQRQVEFKMGRCENVCCWLNLQRRHGREFAPLEHSCGGHGRAAISTFCRVVSSAARFADEREYFVHRAEARDKLKKAFLFAVDQRIDA